MRERASGERRVCVCVLLTVTLPALSTTYHPTQRTLTGGELVRGRGCAAGVQAFFRSELEQCVDRVAALDADAAAYDAFVAKPKLPNNSLRGTIFDIHTVAAQLRQVLRDSESYLMDGQPQEEPL